MILVIVGVVLLGLKLAGMGPVADWSWWVVGAPFAGAVAWWLFADVSGLTQRFAISRFEAKRALRRRRTMEMLGLVVRGRSSATPTASSIPSGLGPGGGTVQPVLDPTPAPRPSPKARSGPDFGDTVPSMIDVPEDIGASKTDRRRLD